MGHVPRRHRYRGPWGTPIHAAAAAPSSTPARSPPRLGLTGHVIVIDHGGGLQTSCNHMYAGGVGGNDGNSTGCHLYFGVYDWGRHTAPEPFMAAWGVDVG